MGPWDARDGPDVVSKVDEAMATMEMSEILARCGDEMKLTSMFKSTDLHELLHNTLLKFHPILRFVRHLRGPERHAG